MLDIVKEIFVYNSNDPLIFTKPFFWFFFFIVIVVIYLLREHQKIKILFLFFSSLFFYYKAGGLFFVLLLISTIVDYFAGLLIDRTNKKSKRRFWLALSLFTNLLILGYFKYTFFLIDIFNEIFSLGLKEENYLAVITNKLFNTNFNVSSIILPVGISFYTFQSMSYTIDVYRKKIRCEKSFINFAFFVSFFPQLVAGPIVRAKEFLPQIKNKLYITNETFSYGLFLIFLGLIKKIVISDYISVNYVDMVFENPLMFSGTENLLAVYGYALQIYCDFSGYSDIAIGLGLLLGYSLPVNFNSPYKAISITDFWHRWHISLSTWLRDYLYISLGGNRKGKIRTFFNLFLTMIIGGLWHGANLKFIVWGLYHGLLLIIERIFNFKKTTSKYPIFRIIIIFHLVCLGWVLFRAKDIKTAYEIYYNIFRLDTINNLLFLLNYKKILLVILIGFIFHFIPESLKERFKGIFIKTPFLLKIIIGILVVYLLYNINAGHLHPFIYFQF